MAFQSKWKKDVVVKACDDAIKHHTKGEKEASLPIKPIHAGEKKRAEKIRTNALMEMGNELLLSQHDAEWVEDWT